VTLRCIYFQVVLALAVACVAANEERVKKDVVGAVPLNYGLYGRQVYDDGKYYPGKYEKTGAVPAVQTYSAAAIPAAQIAAYPAAAQVGALPYNYQYGAYPYNYGAYPVGYNYGSYPYAAAAGYGSYPYAAKSVVY
jgi:hypothetical protein